MSTLGYAHALATDGYVGSHVYELASRGYVDFGIAQIPAEVGEPVAFVTILQIPGSVVADVTTTPPLPVPTANVNPTPGPIAPASLSPPTGANVTVPFLPLSTPFTPLPPTPPTPPVATVMPGPTGVAVPGPALRVLSDSPSTAAGPPVAVRTGVETTIELSAAPARPQRASETIPGVPGVSVRADAGVSLTATPARVVSDSGTSVSSGPVVTVRSARTPMAPGVTVDDDD